MSRSPATRHGTVYVAGMNEMNGGLTNRANKIYRSTDGGNTWSQHLHRRHLPGPGRTTCPNTYFACMFITSRHQWLLAAHGLGSACGATTA